ncbi:hypothetical protein WICPIJ_010063 [Wickerhamomyces pijperi]|uniref:Uncharacterized protein n=1 Tax=Wickerhamomyces pijperi TaxID=599730 RepID=A0A9P8TAF5_WICPI|nr:hypothetical protein WICPIJ_010063 [Wickerhamomyces pijperi]
MVGRISVRYWISCCNVCGSEAAASGERPGSASIRTPSNSNIDARVFVVVVLVAESTPMGVTVVYLNPMVCE